MVRRKAAAAEKLGKPRKPSWAWLVVLIAFVLLVGGGFGALGLTNALARAGYAERISAPEAIGSLTIPPASDPLPILAGTSLETLRQGLGWYEGTSEPGSYGNCAIAGHRLGWGQPFAALDELALGDEIRITTATATYTYKVVTTATIVAGDQSDVLAGVPGDPTRAPTKALLTLTTAASWLPSPNRLVVVAELVAY